MSNDRDKTVAAAAGPDVAADGGGAEDWPTDASGYALSERIGQGAFATVWRARARRRDGGDGALCAVKVMDLEHVNSNLGGECPLPRAGVREGSFEEAFATTERNEKAVLNSKLTEGVLYKKIDLNKDRHCAVGGWRR